MPTIPYSEQAVHEAVDIIRHGGVIAHATETCYGLACDLANPEAVARLFAIKQRPLDQPVSGLFASVEAARQHVIWNDQAEALEQYLPGPLTLILPLTPDSTLLPVLEGAFTLGVRVSSHPHALALALAAGIPLSTTSANVHGLSNPYSAADMENQFIHADNEPDLILDSGALPQVPPSTVIDLTGGSGVRRQGTIRL